MTTEAQEFARELGAEWAGSSEETPPEELDAAIIFAPVGRPRPRGSQGPRQGRDRRLRGHTHERHPIFPLRDLLWEERSVRSVANLTRQDGLEFLVSLPRCPSERASCPSPWSRPTRH